MWNSLPNGTVVHAESTNVCITKLDVDRVYERRLKVSMPAS